MVRCLRSLCLCQLSCWSCQALPMPFGGTVGGLTRPFLVAGPGALEPTSSSPCAESPVTCREVEAETVWVSFRRETAPREPWGGGVRALCLLAATPFALWRPCLAGWLLCPSGICVLGTQVDRPGTAGSSQTALDLPERLHGGRAPKRGLRSTPQVGRMK